MAERYFAIVDDNNIVTDDMVLDVATEADGIQQARDILNDQTATVVETFINANDASTRYNYAGIGYTWDATNNAFYEPQPFPSWTLNETTWTWDAPVPMPTDDKMYTWDEATTNWVEVTD